MQKTHFHRLVITISLGMLFLSGVSVQAQQAAQIPTPAVKPIVIPDASPPMPLPFGKAVAGAELVLVARVTRVTSAPEEKVIPPKPGSLDEAVRATQLLAKSTLRVEQKNTLRGQTPKAFDVIISPIYGLYYGGASFSIREGDHVLLLLRKGRSGGWEPVDSLVPLFKLGGSSTQSSANSVLASALTSSDAGVRRAAAYHLRSVIDPEIIASVRQRADDPDLETRDSILFCLGLNQQTDVVVPRVARLAELYWSRPTKEVPACIITLEQLNSPKAVNLLNPLLFAESPFLRWSAMTALSRLADKSSIPYLMIALRDGDQRSYVSYQAYTILYRLAALPEREAIDLVYFDSHKGQLLKPIYDWYDRELRSSILVANDRPKDKIKIKTDAPPMPWVVANIGAGTDGRASDDNGLFTLISNGKDVFFAQDQFTYVYQSKNTSSISLTATVETVTAAGPATAAGLMIRQSTAPNAYNVNLRVTPTGDVILAYRNAQAPNSVFKPVGRFIFPITLRLNRNGNQIFASIQEKQLWRNVGTISWSKDSKIVLTGLIAFSNKHDSFTTSRFSNIHIDQGIATLKSTVNK
jgi:hypothetical protein